MSTKGQDHSLAMVHGPIQSGSIFFKLLFLNYIPLILTYPQHSGERYRTSGPLVELSYDIRITNYWCMQQNLSYSINDIEI